MNNTRKFDGLAGIYDASRPDYPRDAISSIAEALGDFDGPRLAIDVGAGTGISTRAIASHLPGWHIVALEPNDGMAARAASALSDLRNVHVVAGVAERLPAEDAGAGLITVAQALHWFDRPVFWSEAARALARDGVLAILNNNRRTSACPPILAVEEWLERQCPGYSRHYRTFDIAAEMSALEAFTDVRRVAVPWRRTVTPDSLADYFMSRSTAPILVAKHGQAGARAALVDIITSSAGEAPFAMPIDCEVITAVRRS